MPETCYCHRTFSSTPALKIHQRSCGKNKKRLSAALASAKDIWINRKRRRIEVDGDQSSVNSEGVLVDSAGPTAAYAETPINHDIERPNVLEVSFLSKYNGTYALY